MTANECAQRKKKKEPKIEKIVEKYEKSKKREKWHLFTGLELCLRARMRKKMTWAILKYCDGGSEPPSNGFHQPIPCT